jgi:RNA polymerase II-associated protein 1
MDFSLDIKEKEVGAVKPPSFPQPKSTPTGFPEHKKRTRLSAFKKQRQGADGSAPEPQDGPAISTRPVPAAPAAPAQAPQPARPGPSSTTEKAAIDRENRDLLASMSPGQIEEERQELLSRLDPSIVQMLLRRANIDEPTTPSPFDEPADRGSSTAGPFKPEDAPAIVVDDTTATTPKENRQKKTVHFDEDAPPPEPPAGLFDPSSEPPPPPPPSSTAAADTFAANTTHFPHPKPLPDLDPADPDFLETLHSKYFPNLPADPTKLAWMAPIPTPGSVADQESPYYPGQSSLSIASLRFDFKGRLLPPSKSRSIPVTKGLHHHGQAPEAAGYTIGELGILARSAVPAQRCVAFQTLGRILFRLGQGEWGGSGGGEGDDARADLAKGLWRTVQEAKVIESLLEAAEVPEGQGHRGSRSYAIEALWLFEKGGWKEKFQGR